MTSTAIFAEILVVGLQATVWLALLCLLIADQNGVHVGAITARLSGLKEWAALITTFVIGFAYTLGIIVDRIADSLWSWINGVLISKADDSNKKPGPSVAKKRLEVMSKDDGLTKFLEYIRSRMRIARSTSLNLVLATVAAALLARHSGSLWVLTIIGSGSVLVIISAYVSRRIGKTYDKRLNQAYKLVEDAEKTPVGPNSI